jgi:hypothetical protein
MRAAAILISLVLACTASQDLRQQPDAGQPEAAVDSGADHAGDGAMEAAAEGGALDSGFVDVAVDAPAPDAGSDSADAAPAPAPDSGSVDATTLDSAADATTQDATTADASTNLIQNGDFGQGDQNWTVSLVSGGPDLLSQVSNGQLCLYNYQLNNFVEAALTYSPPAGDALAIEGGAVYSFTYGASASWAPFADTTTEPTIALKIDQLEPPQAELYSVQYQDGYWYTALIYYTHTVIPTAGATAATLKLWIYLNGYTDYICLDDISFTRTRGPS